MHPRELKTPKERIGELLTLFAFLVGNLAVPPFVGDLYPFTVVPMFSDSPQVYCNYLVYDPEGSLLRADDFQLQREYDGNPVGLGAGLVPRPTLDRFGTVPDERAVVDHVARRLAAMDDLRYVDVVQEVIGQVSSEKVGVLRTSQWRVHR